MRRLPKYLYIYLYIYQSIYHPSRARVARNLAPNPSDPSKPLRSSAKKCLCAGLTKQRATPKHFLPLISFLLWPPGFEQISTWSSCLFSVFMNHSEKSNTRVRALGALVDTREWQQ